MMMMMMMVLTTMMMIITNYREVYFGELCWVQRCIFYHVRFYAIQKPALVLCALSTMQFLHCRKCIAGKAQKIKNGVRAWNVERVHTQ